MILLLPSSTPSNLCLKICLREDCSPGTFRSIHSLIACSRCGLLPSHPKVFPRPHCRHWGHVVARGPPMLSPIGLGPHRICGGRENQAATLPLCGSAPAQPYWVLSHAGPTGASRHLLWMPLSSSAITSSENHQRSLSTNLVYPLSKGGASFAKEIPSQYC